jgi:hypothetical protein
MAVTYYAADCFTIQFAGNFFLLDYIHHETPALAPTPSQIKYHYNLAIELTELSFVY